MLSPGAAALHSASGEQFHFGNGCGGFVFERLALLGVVGLGVFACLVLEVKVAEVFVNGLFTLPEVVDTGLVGLDKWISFRPEHEGETGDRHQDYSNKAHQYSV